MTVQYTILGFNSRPAAIAERLGTFLECNGFSLLEVGEELVTEHGGARQEDARRPDNHPHQRHPNHRLHEDNH
jgi:hypothetical protein